MLSKTINPSIFNMWRFYIHNNLPSYHLFFSLSSTNSKQTQRRIPTFTKLSEIFQPDILSSFRVIRNVKFFIMFQLVVFSTLTAYFCLLPSDNFDILIKICTWHTLNSTSTTYRLNSTNYSLPVFYPISLLFDEKKVTMVGVPRHNFREHKSKERHAGCKHWFKPRLEFRIPIYNILRKTDIQNQYLKFAYVCSSQIRYPISKSLSH